MLNYGVKRTKRVELILLWLLLLILCHINIWEENTLQLTEEVIDYVLVAPPYAKIDQVDSLTPDYASTFMMSLRESYSKLTTADKNGKKIELKDNEKNKQNQSKISTLLRQMLQLLTKRKRTCKKLIRLGGSTCRKLSEGAK